MPDMRGRKWEAYSSTLHSPSEKRHEVRSEESRDGRDAPLPVKNDFTSTLVKKFYRCLPVITRKNSQH